MIDLNKAHKEYYRTKEELEQIRNEHNNQREQFKKWKEEMIVRFNEKNKEREQIIIELEQVSKNLQKSIKKG